MRKRLTAWRLALVMALTLVGCGDDVTVIGVTTGGDQTPQQQEQQECERGEDDAPEPFDGFGQRFMRGLFFHRFNSICRKDRKR